MEYLYLIKCNEYHKIGIARDVEERIAQLSTGNPYELSLVYCFEFPNSMIVEKAIHQSFQDVRKRGEWFLLTQQHIDKFCEICLLLGGNMVLENVMPNENDIESAEEEAEYQNKPTIQDVLEVMKDKRYHLEYRYNDKKQIRAYIWRCRIIGNEGILSVSKSNPIFEQVKDIVGKEAQ